MGPPRAAMIDLMLDAIFIEGPRRATARWLSVFLILMDCLVWVSAALSISSAA